MYKACFGNPRLNASQFSEYTIADFGIECMSERESHALFMLHQWLLIRYQALNGSPINFRASAVLDFTPNERTNARPASEETFATEEDTQYV